MRLMLPIGDTHHIPPLVHQVWVGSEPPAWVQHSWREWDEFAESDGLTTMRHLDELPFTARLCSRYPLTPVQRANLIRLEALSFYGGIYMDTDIVPLRSLQRFHGKRPAWIGTLKSWEGTESRWSCNNAT